MKDRHGEHSNINNFGKFRGVLIEKSLNTIVGGGGKKGTLSKRVDEGIRKEGKRKGRDPHHRKRGKTKRKISSRQGGSGRVRRAVEGGDGGGRKDNLHQSESKANIGTKILNWDGGRRVNVRKQKQGEREREGGRSEAEFNARGDERRR